jgi:hypothetical protein
MLSALPITQQLALLPDSCNKSSCCASQHFVQVLCKTNSRSVKFAGISYL